MIIPPSSNSENFTSENFLDSLSSSFSDISERQNTKSPKLPYDFHKTKV